MTFLEKFNKMGKVQKSKPVNLLCNSVLKLTFTLADYYSI